MSEFVKTTRYGFEESQPPDIVLLATRGNRGEAFFEKFPGLMQALDVSCEARAYLELERAAGSAETAHEIALAINGKVPRGENLKVHVVEALLPAGIIDANELSADKALRRVLPWGDSPLLMGYIQKIHAEVICAIDEELKKLKARGGVFVDIQTTLPFSPALMPIGVTPQVRPYHLREYISMHEAAVTFARREKAKTIERMRRVLRLQTCDEEGILADVRLRHTLTNALSHWGEQRWAENMPCLDRSSLLAARLRTFPGIGVEIPRDFLADLAQFESPFALTYAKLDRKKVMALAEPISHALVERIAP